jgi:hypothetical protein
VYLHGEPLCFATPKSQFSLLFWLLPALWLGPSTSGTKVPDVKVDADKGMIISSIEDKADQDEGNDKAD